MKSNLYYEAHITIEPAFDENLVMAGMIASKYKFKVADLLMKKREVDTEERSKNDTFMTGHDQDSENLTTRMSELIRELQLSGFKVWRYKLEDTVFDSRVEDLYGWLQIEC